MSSLSDVATWWMSHFPLHLVETSMFLMLVWLVDRYVTLSVRTRYLVALLALAKLFVPPVVSFPALIQHSVMQGMYSLPAGGVIAAVAGRSEHTTTLPLTFILWLGSAIFMTAFFVFRNVSLRLTLSRANPLPPSVLPSLLVHMRRVALFETSAVQAPLLLGFARPRLYLPEDWPKWPRKHLYSVIAHELSHLSYGDIWVLFLQHLSLVLFAVNPLVWWLHRHLSRLREFRCDEVAVRQTSISVTDYSRFLLSFVERTPSVSAVVLGKSFAGKKKSLAARIQNLINMKEETMESKKLVRFVLPALLALLILPLSWRCGDQAPSAGQAVAPVGGQTLGANFRFQEYDTPPMPVGGFAAIQKNLHYPELARRAGIEGKVFLRILVSETGEVKETRVLKVVDGGEHAGLAEAAVSAVRSVKWTPAKKDGRPVSVRVVLPVIFRLNGSKSAQGAVWQNRSKSAQAVAWRPPEPVGGFAALQAHLRYPEAGRKAGVDGQVLVEVVLDEHGEIQKTRIRRGLEEGKLGFEDAAVAAVRSVKWHPARRDGEPVGFMFTVPVTFKLK